MKTVEEKKTSILLGFSLFIATTQGFLLAHEDFKTICGSDQAWISLDFRTDFDDFPSVEGCALSLYIPKEIPNENVTRSFSKTKVKMLKLSGKISESLIREFENLKYLELAGNDLSESDLVKGEGKFCGTLEWLDLSATNLSDVRFLKTRCDSLKRLDLNSNKLAVVPLENLENFPNLKDLSFYRNEITGFSNGTFQTTFATMKHLDISHNHLGEVEKLKHFPNLEYLNLKNQYKHQIRQLEGDFFDDLRLSLIEFRVDGNRIETLDVDTLLNMKHLRRLFMERNSMRKIVCETKRADQTDLELLNLAHNDLEELPRNLFEFFPHLKTIIISDNRLNRLQSGLFGPLKHVAHVDLSRNRIALFNFAILSISPTITELNIEENRIDDIDYFTLLSQSYDLKKLRLSENPFPCDKLEDISKFLKYKRLELSKSLAPCSSGRDVDGVCCVDVEITKNDSRYLEKKMDRMALAMMERNDDALKRIQELLVTRNDNQNGTLHVQYEAVFIFWVGLLILVLILNVFLRFRIKNKEVKKSNNVV